MVEPAAALYRGTLAHRRYDPVRHEFRYPLFMVWLDVDRVAEAMAASWCTSWNRWNWASFDDRDHFGDPAVPLRERVQADARANGIELPDGPIYLLTHLRYLGYAFNPVSFFYCYDAAGALHAVLAEVSNTFGGRQNYWLTDAAALAGHGRAKRYRARKAFYVSPFNDMNEAYTFTFTEPGEDLVVHMNVDEAGRRAHFNATLTLERQPWQAATILRTLLQYPWMTASVVVGIHWQAFRLWRKGVPVVPRGPDDRAPHVAGGQQLGAQLDR